jgi:hypothetical protein
MLNDISIWNALTLIVIAASVTASYIKLKSKISSIKKILKGHTELAKKKFVVIDKYMIKEAAREPFMEQRDAEMRELVKEVSKGMLEVVTSCQRIANGIDRITEDFSETLKVLVKK